MINIVDTLKTKAELKEWIPVVGAKNIYKPQKTISIS